MKTRTTIPLLAILALLAACGESEGRGGLTAEEERMLDNAAAMLDDNMIEITPDSLVANELELEAMDEGTGGNDAEVLP